MIHLQDKNIENHRKSMKNSGFLSKFQCFSVENATLEADPTQRRQLLHPINGFSHLQRESLQIVWLLSVSKLQISQTSEKYLRHSGSNAQTQTSQRISMDFHGLPRISISWGLLHLILLDSSPDLHSRIAVSFSKHSSPSQDLVVSNSQDSRSCYNSQRQLHVSESLDSRCPMLSWEYPNLPGHSLAGPAN